MSDAGAEEGGVNEKFAVGDLCELVRIPGARYKPHLEYVWGMQGTIASLRVSACNGIPCHGVILDDGLRVLVSENCLRKVPPPNEIVRWSECIWRPAGLREGA